MSTITKCKVCGKFHGSRCPLVEASALIAPSISDAAPPAYTGPLSEKERRRIAFEVAAELGWHTSESCGSSAGARPAPGGDAISRAEVLALIAEHADQARCSGMGFSANALEALGRYVSALPGAAASGGADLVALDAEFNAAEKTVAEMEAAILSGVDGDRRDRAVLAYGDARERFGDLGARIEIRERAAASGGGEPSEDDVDDVTRAETGKLARELCTRCGDSSWTWWNGKEGGGWHPDVGGGYTRCLAGPLIYQSYRLGRAVVARARSAPRPGGQAAGQAEQAFRAVLNDYAISEIYGACAREVLAKHPAERGAASGDTGASHA